MDSLQVNSTYLLNFERNLILTNRAILCKKNNKNCEAREEIYILYNIYV